MRLLTENLLCAEHSHMFTLAETTARSYYISIGRKDAVPLASALLAWEGEPPLPRVRLAELVERLRDHPFWDVGCPQCRVLLADFEALLAETPEEPESKLGHDALYYLVYQLRLANAAAQAVAGRLELALSRTAGEQGTPIDAAALDRELKRMLDAALPRLDPDLLQAYQDALTDALRALRGEEAGRCSTSS
jgi:hypothetical protein